VPATLEMRAGDAADAMVATGLQCLVRAARYHGVHLTAAGLAREYGLGSEEPGGDQLGRIANDYGLRLDELSLDRRQLARLASVTPAIIRLTNGNAMLLLEVTGAADAAMATLYDPAVGEATPLVIELARLAAAADGGVLLIQRDGVAAESRSQPFDMSWLLHEVMREHR